jgi:hypothetical protein
MDQYVTIFKEGEKYSLKMDLSPDGRAKTIEMGQRLGAEAVHQMTVSDPSQMDPLTNIIARANETGTLDTEALEKLV